MIRLDKPPAPVIVRCPRCGHRQFDAFLTGESFVVMQCACKAKFRVDANELFVITTAASVSRTFDGRTYEGLGLAIR